VVAVEYSPAVCVCVCVRARACELRLALVCQCVSSSKPEEGIDWYSVYHTRLVTGSVVTCWTRAANGWDGGRAAGMRADSAGGVNRCK
jgi:hypothetical protein